MFLSNSPITKFERQLEYQEELVLHDINKDHSTKISKERLREVLKILHEFRVVD